MPRTVRFSLGGKKTPPSTAATTAPTTAGARARGDPAVPAVGSLSDVRSAGDSGLATTADDEEELEEEEEELVDDDDEVLVDDEEDEEEEDPLAGDIDDDDDDNNAADERKSRKLEAAASRQYRRSVRRTRPPLPKSCQGTVPYAGSASSRRRRRRSVASVACWTARSRLGTCVCVSARTARVCWRRGLVTAAEARCGRTVSALRSLGLKRRVTNYRQDVH